MIFNPSPLDGAYTIDLERRGDDRGFFARVFCENEFAAERLETRFVQVNNSLSADKGTLRGMHYQLPPSQEVKLVRCIRGALWDVILDLRSDSATFGRWFGEELSAENRLGYRGALGRLAEISSLLGDEDSYVREFARAAVSRLEGEQNR